jgi:hypothetical protein
MTLGQLIEVLEKLPQDYVFKHGFYWPHSYRGYYEQMAFAPKENTSVKDMLDAARSAVGATFEGYKGGDYIMTKSTKCWLAQYGRSGFGANETLGASGEGGEIEVIFFREFLEKINPQYV